MNPFEKFKSQAKFLEDESLLYPGISDPGLRPLFTKKIDQAADDFEALWKSGNSSSRQYLSKLETGLARFSDFYLDLDTEDRERICSYFEELMGLAGMEDPGGQLESFARGGRLQGKN